MNEIVKKIYEVYTSFPHDVQTNPLRKNVTPRWFHVSNVGNKIVISNAVEHNLSSNITGNRVLDIANAEKMIDLYLRRKKGEAFFEEARNSTRNQVYWFGILKDLGY